MTPLLRAPPWPGAATELSTAACRDGCVTGHAESDDPDLPDPEMARQVAQAMASARVGGSFWGRQIPGRRSLAALGQDDPVREGGAVAMLRARVSGAVRRAARAAAGDVDPWPLIEAADEVIAARGDEVGILALAAGRRVIAPDGTRLDDEGGAVFVRGLLAFRYRDPVTGGSIDALEATALLGRWRALIDSNRGLVAAAGMAFWKRREVVRLLWDGRAGTIPFLGPRAAIRRARREGGAVAAWPARVPADFADRAAAAGVPVRWVEDGFLRSAGLGSDLLPPLSLIVDDLWPYFDPARASRLETLLQTAPFDDGLIARAAALRRTIVERRIGKYRVGDPGGGPADLPADTRLVVAVGQVEDDLSMLRGGAGMTNLSLLKRTRAAEPDAFIIYRPHPDVEAGHRKGRVADAVALGHVDRIDRNGSLDALLARADTLHTITSLAGFEALLRGVRVVVHGGPWYAGWGLTEDLGPPLPRRTRRLSLDALVAAGLILYPRYLHPGTGLPSTVEQFIDGLGGVRVHAGWLVRLRRWQGRLRRVFR